MSEDREVYFHCESCSKPIHDDEAYYCGGDGCYFCEECVPMLSDAVSQHKEILEAVPFDQGELPYETRDEMKTAYQIMRADLAQSGDRKLFTWQPDSAVKS